MTYMHGSAIKSIKSADGKNYVDIIARNDGFFEFRAHTWVKDEDDHAYWLATYNSGLYDQADTAEHEAEKVIPWLRVQISD